MNKNVDRIAKIIHDGWMEWTKSLSDIEDFDQLISEADRWEKLWVPYEQLSKEMKEKDREWARKIIRVEKMDECEYMAHRFLDDICNDPLMIDIGKILDKYYGDKK